MTRLPGLGRAAVLVGGLSAGSLLLGFARDVVIAAVFGAGPEMDAYLVAQGLMTLVLALVAGALANAVIPVVAPAVAAGDPRPAHRSVATALTIATAVLGATAVGVGLLAGPLLAVLAPGFDPATSTLAAKLTRIVLVATVLMAATNVLAAVAQSHRRFFWAGVQGIPFNLVMIVAAAGFGPTYGVTALAIGFIAGSAVRMLLQLVPLRQLGVRLVPSLDVRGPGLRAIARLLPALLLTDVVVSLGTIIDRAVASTQGEGTITALSCSWRIVSLPNILVITSCLAVLYPALGAAAANTTELRRLVDRGLGVVTLILLPAIAVLIAAATPVAAMVYGRGNYQPAAVNLTATALAWYAPGLLPLAWREVAARACYAVGDSSTPLRAVLLGLAVKLAGDLSLGLSFGAPGIAASNVLALTTAAAVTLHRLARRKHGIALPDALHAVGRLTLAGVLAGGAAAAARITADAVAGPAAAVAGWDSAARITATAIVTLAVYTLVLARLQAPELRMLGQARRTAVSRLRLVLSRPES